MVPPPHPRHPVDTWLVCRLRAKAWQPWIDLAWPDPSGMTQIELSRHRLCVGTARESHAMRGWGTGKQEHPRMAWIYLRAGPPTCRLGYRPPQPADASSSNRPDRTFGWRVPGSLGRDRNAPWMAHYEPPWMGSRRVPGRATRRPPTRTLKAPCRWRWRWRHSRKRPCRCCCSRPKTKTGTLAGARFSDSRLSAGIRPFRLPQPP